MQLNTVLKVKKCVAQQVDHGFFGLHSNVFYLVNTLKKFVWKKKLHKDLRW